jgi:hypothetical protein
MLDLIELCVVELVRDSEGNGEHKMLKSSIRAATYALEAQGEQVMYQEIRQILRLESLDVLCDISWIPSV